MIDGNLLSSFSIMPSYADAIVPILKSPSEVAPTNACVRGDPGRGTRTSRRTVVAQVLTYAAALFGLDPRAPCGASTDASSAEAPRRAAGGGNRRFPRRHRPGVSHGST